MVSQELKRAKSLLSQALNAANASLQSGPSVSEAKKHIKQAISKLDEIKKPTKSQETQAQKWWNNIQSGVAKISNQPVAKNDSMAAQKSLDQLNYLLKQEEEKLNKLNQIDDPNIQLNEDSK